MKRFVKFWWVLPLLLGAATYSLILCTVPTPVKIAILVVWVILFVALIASWVLLFKDRHWVKAIISILVFLFMVCLPLLPLVLLYFDSQPDDFGKEHPIPEGMAYNIPLPAGADSIYVVDSTDVSSYLQVRNDTQGGTYKYDFYYGSLEPGTIYLRCYEVTSNTSLSTRTLHDKSSVEVDAHNHFGQVVSGQAFTIYEGDWEDYYAARIEVWFKSADTKEERKLMEKVYRIEGWMR